MATNQNLGFQEYVNTHTHQPNKNFNVYLIVKPKKGLKMGLNSHTHES
jgi:hypothetical protein